MTPDMKIKALVHAYEFELEDRKKDLKSLLSDDVTCMFSVAVVKVDMVWIERFLKELKH